ncbi:hypothetical protein F7731_04940 [Cytobacillus depressus]|uniref:Uncharacterized protein n=1 Tax=Cytobacillus depressus TaxID=1602942 RepID=A0A6L3VIP2_9BACI|nr:hypothetical protein [Cytobacillus depressus]KAB2338895.1 hypothetical protein F7731_04940 [Cytobacillus depressus]
MKGIYFKTEKKSQDDVLSYMKENHIQNVKLNPYQIHDYYTNPHALLYDLKQTKAELDCFIIPSRTEIEEFIHMYPAKWLLLKSYFKNVLFFEGHGNGSLATDNGSWDI